MKKMSKMAKMMAGGMKKPMMKKGGVSSKQMDMLKTMAKNATAAQKQQLAKAKMGMESKPLLKMAKMGMSVDMVEPMMTRMDQAAYGMEKMMEGGMKKMKLPKRGMRRGGHMMRKKKKR